MQTQRKIEQKSNKWENDEAKRRNFIPPLKYLLSEHRSRARTPCVWYRSRRPRRSRPHTGTPCWPSPCTPSPPPGFQRRRCCSTDTWAGSSRTRWSAPLGTAHIWWAWLPCSARPCACRADTCRRWAMPLWSGLGARRWGRSPAPRHRRGQRRAGRAAVRESEESTAIIVLLLPQLSVVIAYNTTVTCRVIIIFQKDTGCRYHKKWWQTRILQWLNEAGDIRCFQNFLEIVKISILIINWLLLQQTSGVSLNWFWHKHGMFQKMTLL